MRRTPRSRPRDASIGQPKFTGAGHYTRPFRFKSMSRPASLARLAVDRPGVRHRTQVPELVGVDHRADCLDLTLKDVERPRVDDLAVPIPKDRARLAVHLVRLHYATNPDEGRGYRGEHPGHVRGTDDGLPLRGFAAGVRDPLNVSGEQLPPPVDIPFPEGIEESLGKFLALPSVGLEPRAARLHVAPRPLRELAARR